VHQFVFGTTIVRECSRQEDILVAAFTWWLRNRTAVEHGTYEAKRIRSDHCGTECTPRRPSEHRAMLAVVATRNQCLAHVNSVRRWCRRG
jgi:hypothetical protein